LDSDRRAQAVRRELERYADGVHRLGAPAVVLDADLPTGLAAIYRVFDGADLFHEGLVFYPAGQLRREKQRLRVGEVGGDELWVAQANGTVWRSESDTGEWVEEGTAFDVWIHGFVDAEGLLYAWDGEFRDQVFDEMGELLPELELKRERRMLRRDRRAPGPRWRLARGLARRGDLEAARLRLEELVAVRPAFHWAWYDLARISERLAQSDSARTEMEEAARLAAAGCSPYAGLFWAHAARLAAAAHLEPERARLAAEALAAEPDLLRSQREGARVLLEIGDREGAGELARLACALAPRDLDLLDLLHRIG
jgi:hypothetical protein